MSIIQFDSDSLTNNQSNARCDAKPSDLDADDARLRTRGKDEFLISTFDPGILWTDFGIRADIVVCHL